MEFWSSRTLEKIRVPDPPANDEFTLLRLSSSRNTPFSSHWILTIPPSLRPMGDRQVKVVDLLLLTAATRIGGVIITPSNNKGVLHIYRNSRCAWGKCWTCQQQCMVLNYTYKPSIFDILHAHQSKIRFYICMNHAQRISYLYSYQLYSLVYQFQRTNIAGSGPIWMGRN